MREHPARRTPLFTTMLRWEIHLFSTCGGGMHCRKWILLQQRLGGMTLPALCTPTRYSAGQPPRVEEGGQPSLRLRADVGRSYRHLRRRLLPKARLLARDPPVPSGPLHRHPPNAAVLPPPGGTDVGGAGRGSKPGIFLSLDPGGTKGRRALLRGSAASCVKLPHACFADVATSKGHTGTCVMTGSAA